MSTPFTYTRMGKTSIRLLEVVSAGEDGALIECKLSRHMLSKLPSYDAISYTWGNNLLEETIICDGGMIQISAGVKEMIRTLAIYRPDPTPYIWVDTICINQQDDVEKGSQVPLMREVYSRAERMIVWLGPAGPYTNIAMTALPTLKMAFQMASTKGGRYIASGLLSRPRLADYGLPGESDPVWPGLRDLLSRPWFSRLWVLQEAVLGKRCFLMCGRAWLEWSVFSEVWETFSKSSLSDFYVVDTRGEQVDPEGIFPSKASVTNVTRVQWVRQKYLLTGSIEGEDLISVLEIGRSKNVSQEIDRIWGFLGLMSTELRAALTIFVDYAPEERSQYWKTYTRFAKVLMKNNDDLSLLTCEPSRSRPDGLPSWCCNFTETIDRDAKLINRTAGYTAGISEETAFPPAACSLSSDVLQLGGFRLDVVDKVVGRQFLADLIDAEQSLPDFEKVTKLASSHLERFDQCLALCQQLYSTSTDMPDQLWRTLIGDRVTMQRYWEYPLDQGYAHVFELIKAYFAACAAGTDAPKPDDPLEFARYHRYMNMLNVYRRRPFFSTKGGRVGLGPEDIQPGDVVCVLYYGAPLYILRPVRDEPIVRYIYIGYAYVYGGMAYKENVHSADRGVEEIFHIE